MNLTDKQLQMLRKTDLIELSQKARQKAMPLLNDQGLTMLSLVVSNFMADIVDRPEKLVKEFTS